MDQSETHIIINVLSYDYTGTSSQSVKLFRFSCMKCGKASHLASSYRHKNEIFSNSTVYLFITTTVAPEAEQTVFVCRHSLQWAGVSKLGWESAEWSKVKMKIPACEAMSWIMQVTFDEDLPKLCPVLQLKNWSSLLHLPVLTNMRWTGKSFVVYQQGGR